MAARKLRKIQILYSPGVRRLMDLDKDARLGVWHDQHERDGTLVTRKLHSARGFVRFWNSHYFFGVKLRAVTLTVPDQDPDDPEKREENA